MQTYLLHFVKYLLWCSLLIFILALMRTHIRTSMIKNHHKMVAVSETLKGAFNIKRGPGYAKLSQRVLYALACNQQCKIEQSVANCFELVSTPRELLSNFAIDGNYYTAPDISKMEFRNCNTYCLLLTKFNPSPLM